MNSPEADQQTVYVAFNKTENRYVPFKSASDAAIASLVLTHGLSDETLQTVMKAICQTEYNPRDVTLFSNVDIQIHVGEERVKALEVAEGRTTRQDPKEHLNTVAKDLPLLRGIPDIVFDSIIAVITDVMDSAFADLRYHTAWKDMLGYIFNPLPGTLSPFRKLLLTMSLVHPSWTLPAYRLIGRYLPLIFRLDPKNDYASLEPRMLRCLASPLYGEWTRGVEVGVGLYYLSDIELFRTLCATKLKGLRCLKINVLSASSAADPRSRILVKWRETFLGALRELTRLEELHLAVDDVLEGGTFMPLMTGVVSCMASTINFFRLVGDGIHPTPTLISPLSSLVTETAVETINVDAFSGDIVENITWKRLDANADFILQETIIGNYLHTYHDSLNVEGLQGIRDVLASTPRLQLGPPLAPARIAPEAFVQLLELSSSLRHLQFCVSCEGYDTLSEYPGVFLSTCSPTLEYLTIQFIIKLATDSMYAEAVFKVLSWWTAAVQSIVESRSSGLDSRFEQLKRVRLQVKWSEGWFSSYMVKENLTMSIEEAKERLDTISSQIIDFIDTHATQGLSFDWQGGISL